MIIFDDLIGDQLDPPDPQKIIELWSKIRLDFNLKVKTIYLKNGWTMTVMRPKNETPNPLSKAR